MCVCVCVCVYIYICIYTTIGHSGKGKTGVNKRLVVARGWEERMG